MPNVAAISLVTANETLVFSPSSVEPQHILFQNAAEGNLQKRELLHFDRAKDEKTTMRRTARVNVPLVRTVEGKEILKQGALRIEAVLPSDCTEAERLRLQLLAEQLVKNTFSRGIFVAGEWGW